MLDAKLTVLELAREEDEAGNVVFGWLPFHDTWGTYELKQAKNIFSSVAIGARTVELTLRKQELTLRHSVLRGERQLFITQIDDTSDRHRMTVTAALLDPVSCVLEKEGYSKNELNRLVPAPAGTLTFPAWITEKYVGRQQQEPQVVIDTMFVLITPKEIELTAGDLVTVNEKPFEVWICHTLDADKNEYEIARKDEA